MILECLESRKYLKNELMTNFEREKNGISRQGEASTFGWDEGRRGSDLTLNKSGKWIRGYCSLFSLRSLELKFSMSA